MLKSALDILSIILFPVAIIAFPQCISAFVGSWRNSKTAVDDHRNCKYEFEGVDDNLLIEAQQLFDTGNLSSEAEKITEQRVRYWNRAQEHAQKILDKWSKRLGISDDGEVQTGEVPGLYQDIKRYVWGGGLRYALYGGSEVQKQVKHYRECSDGLRRTIDFASSLGHDSLNWAAGPVREALGVDHLEPMPFPARCPADFKALGVSRISMTRNVHGGGIEDAEGLLFVHLDKSYDKSGNVLNSEATELLARRLKCLTTDARAQTPHCGLLRCAGYLSDQKLVFNIPNGARASSICTLRDLLMGKQRPKLEDRIQIAQTLAVTVAVIHSLGILVKSINPESIIFFTENYSEDSTRYKLTPYLIGFGQARTNETQSGCLSYLELLLSYNIYVHPDHLAKRRKKFELIDDMYGLGICLMEIILWQSLLVKRGSKEAVGSTPCASILSAQTTPSEVQQSVTAANGKSSPDASSHHSPWTTIGEKDSSAVDDGSKTPAENFAYNSNRDAERRDMTHPDNLVPNKLFLDLSDENVNNLLRDEHEDRCKASGDAKPEYFKNGPWEMALKRKELLVGLAKTRIVHDMGSVYAGAVIACLECLSGYKSGTVPVVIPPRLNIVCGRQQETTETALDIKLVNPWDAKPALNTVLESKLREGLQSLLFVRDVLGQLEKITV